MTDEGTNPLCGNCPAPIEVGSAMFFDVLTPVAHTSGRVTAELSTYVVMCPDCAALLVGRRLGELVQRSREGKRTAPGAQSEMIAFALKLADSVGPPMTFADWSAAHNEGA